MELQKVTYIDLVTIIEAQNLNDIQDAIIDLEEWQEEVGEEIPQILANIAPEFSNSTSYSAGDCVIVLNKLYQFTADHPAGDWTGADAAEVNVTSLLKEAAASLSGDIDSVKADALTAYATDTASGAIASFPDGADDIPVKDLSVGIEPVQDLHGYANPWPGGGMGNLQNPDWAVFSDGVTHIVNADGSETFTNNTAGATAVRWVVTGQLPAGNYTVKNFDGETLYVKFSSSDYDHALTNNQYYSFSYDGSSYLVLQHPNLEAGQTKTYKHAIVAGSTAPETFYPYSNICPISGWTGAEVTRTGKNLLDAKSGKSTVTSAGITAVKNADGSYNVTGTASGVVNLWLRGEWSNTTPFMKLYAGRTYYIKDVTPYGGTEGLSNTVNIGGSTTYTPSKDVFVTGIRATTPSGTTLNTVVYPYIGLVPYEEWQEFGDTYSITFPSEAGTVYGGTLDVTTGKLTVDRAMVDLGTLTWTKANTSSGKWWFRTNMSTAKLAPSGNEPANCVCSSYKTLSPNDLWGGQLGAGVNASSPQIIVADLSYDDANTFKTAMNGVQFCYELATPTVYDLTPTEVRTLLAQNNIWADCGDSTVEYRADTKLYIDKKIAALAAAMN